MPPRRPDADLAPVARTTVRERGERTAVREREARAPARDRGIALFTAIWVGMAVSVVALGVARETRTSATIAHNEARAAEAAAAAEAGLVRLALALAAEAGGAGVALARDEAPGPGVVPLDGQAPIGLDGRGYALAIDGAEVRLSARAMAGRLDLNAADPALLAAAFDALEGARGRAIASAVLAHRAAEAEGRLSWRLDDRPFDTVADLVTLGIATPAEHLRLAPLLTVEGETRAPVLAWAPEALLDALPIEAETRAQALRARDADPPPGAAWSGRLVLELTAEARLGDGTLARRGSVVAVEPGARPAISVVRRLADRRPVVAPPSR